MERDEIELEKVLKGLLTYPCPVCKGTNIQGDKNPQEFVLPSGTAHSYLVLWCLNCGFMRFHFLSMSAKTENLAGL